MEPPRETTYRRFGSVHAMSRMVEAPINRLGALCVGCVGCVLGTLCLDEDNSVVNDATWAASNSFLLVRSSTDSTRRAFISKTFVILSCNCITTLLNTVMDDANDRHVGHTHHGVSLSTSLTHISWYQRKHMQHRIISPDPERCSWHWSWQCNVSLGCVTSSVEGFATGLGDDGDWTSPSFVTVVSLGGSSAESITGVTVFTSVRTFGGNEEARVFLLGW